MLFNHPVAKADVRSKAVDLLLLIGCLLLLSLWGSVFVPCCALLYVLSSFAIILMGNIELVALLCLSFRYLVNAFFCGSSSRCRWLVFSV